MVRVFSVLASMFATAFAGPVDIDNTCASCSRYALDSLNYNVVNPIRVNQVGYRTAEVNKVAFVATKTATPTTSTYTVIDTAGKVAWSGTLASLGKYDSLKARMLIIGYNHSISVAYSFGDSAVTPQPEYLWKADFGGLTTEGFYRVVVGKDTSHVFGIRETIYNDVFETSLKFFGAQRCGNTKSWFHKACHTKDGSALGHEGELQGGWHDCGDHGKYGETEGYAASMLALAYAAMPEKAENRFGESYDDTLPLGYDMYPDLLWEAKIGADYIYRLYSRSKADGLIDKADMYHTVGMGPGMDHLYWERPEFQDAQAQNKGGPNRPVTAGIGGNVAGMYIVSLALVGASLEIYDPDYGKKLVDAAIDMYDKVLIPKRFTKTNEPCCYDGGGQMQDDPAFAAVALWYATGQSRFGYDLYQNKAYGTNPGSVYSVGEFAAGLLGNGPITAGGAMTKGYFDHGGWTTDFQQNNQMALYAFGKLILKDTATAANYGIGPELRDSLLLDVMMGLKRGISIGSNGSDKISFPGINVDQPYHGVFTSAGWGFNRYNMGMVTEMFMYWDLEQRTHFWQSMKGKTVPGRLTRPEIKTFVDGWTESGDQSYLQVGVDNLNYQLGVNPWDVSFIMGMGTKNLQHPHNRASNPEGYNAGGIRYDYKVPKGALMGGCKPGQLLKDYWLDYTVTETCIDFSAQLVIPTLILSKDLPPDNEGPEFQNVVVVQVADSSALIAWQTNEYSRDTLYYSLTPGGPVVGKVGVTLEKNKNAALKGLVPLTTYYFWFKGTDVYRNVSTDNNRGRYYQFTTTDKKPVVPKIYDVRVCNIRSNQATVFWWTNVVSTSLVEFAQEGKVFPIDKDSAWDDERLPGRFHKVTLKGLTPGTAYRFDVTSGSAKDDSSGKHYRFETTQDFANYTIQMKATTKNYGSSGKGAHFYLLVANNETKPYAGLELRVYFKATAAVAKAMVVNNSDNAIWGGGGTMLGGKVKVKIDSARPYGTSGNIWYFPITIEDTIPVSGSARIEMKMDSTNWKPVSFSAFDGSWSFAPHTAPPDPVAFPGIDMTKPWAGPEQYEKVNGFDRATYVNDPYITAHYKGVHIFGYPPDGAKPRVFRTTVFDFSKPVPSPAISVKQDSVPVHFRGRTWSFPDVVAAQWQVDAPVVRPSTPLAGQKDSVNFAHDTLDAQGATSHEFAFWGDRDSSYCSCAWQRYTVVVDTMKNPPRPLRLLWDTAGPVDVWTTQRRVLTVRLVDSTGNVLDTNVSVSLSSQPNRVKFWTSAAATSGTSSLSLVHGSAQIWVSNDAADTAELRASAAITGSDVTTGQTTVRFTLPPPWPSVDSSWTKDANCDGKPDSVVIALSGALPTGVDLKTLDLVLGGAKISVPVASIRTSGRFLSVTAPAGGSGSLFGSGRLVLHVSTGGRNLDTGYVFAVSDRTGPVLVSISAQERFDAGADTVRAAFSEAVSSKSGWPFQIRRAGSPVASPSGRISVRNALPDLLEWSLDGTSFASSDSAIWSDPNLVVDSAGNPAQACKSPGVVGLRRKTVPLGGATMLDVDGDGRVDSVRVRFVRAVSDAELPDSIRVEWGMTNSVVSVPRSALVRSDDSTSLSMPVPFAWGATSWPLARPNILVIQGNATDGRRDPILASDEVGPVLTGATLRRGAGTDTLRIRISEPSRAGSGPELEYGRANGWSSNLRFALSDSVTWLLVAPAGTFLDGDSVRLAGTSLGGAYKDGIGNPAAPNAPWIQVQAGDPAPSFATVQDLDGDGRAETVRLVWDRHPRRDHGFVFGDAVRRDGASSDGKWTDSGDTLVVDLSDPFPFGTTSGFGKGVQTEVFSDGTVDTLSFALIDGAGPVVVAASLHYASEGQNLDTLVVRSSEAVEFMGPVRFRVVGSGGGGEQDVVGISPWQSPDARTFYLLLDPTDATSSKFRKGDRIRFSSGEAGTRDMQGNFASPQGHLEPIVFGMRPPRFDLDFLPGTIVESDPGKPVGAPIEILVRPYGDNSWKTLEGRSVAGETKRIGPHIRTNSALGGSLSIFDNQGTFVAGIDLGELDKSVRTGTMTTDPAGQYEVWIGWNGASASGGKAASGVYAVRLILRRDAFPGTSLFGHDWMNRVYKIGWVVK